MNGTRPAGWPTRDRWRGPGLSGMHEAAPSSLGDCSRPCPAYSVPRDHLGSDLDLLESTKSAAGCPAKATLLGLCTPRPPSRTCWPGGRTRTSGAQARPSLCLRFPVHVATAPIPTAVTRCAAARAPPSPERLPTEGWLPKHKGVSLQMAR